MAVAAQRPWHNNWHHGYWNRNNWGNGLGRNSWGGGGGWGYGPGWGGGYGSGYGLLGYGGWGRGWGWGYGPRFWGGYGNRSWFAGPLGWGLGAWALGSIVYDSGYMGYSNPYLAGAPVAVSSVYDYANPIPVVAEQNIADTSAPQIVTDSEHFDMARQAFRAGDYEAAQREVDMAITQNPNDTALHEFRSLVLFARGEYQQAAAVLYAVMSAGPGWDWTTLSSMYANVDVYTVQLRELENFVKSNPNSPDARLLLAYHYITCNHTDAAVQQLTEVARLQPKDRVAGRLLAILAPNARSEEPTPMPPEVAATEPTAAEEPPTPPDVDSTAIVGTWNATRPDEAMSFRLTLTPDAKFTWSYTQQGKSQEFAGTYTVDGPILVLKRADGATMPGLVTPKPDGFNFKLYGGPDDDQGLDFKS